MKNFIYKKKHAIFICLIFFYFHFFSQEIGVITKKNIHKKILKAYDISDDFDTYDYLDDLISFVKVNEIKINNIEVKGKYIYLNSLLNYYRYYAISENSYKNLLKVEKIAKKINNKYLLASTYQLLAYYEGSIGNNNAKLIYTKKTIQLLEEINAKHKLVDLYFNICVLYKKNEDWNNVIINAQNSITLITDLNYKNSRLKWLNLYLATAHLYLKNYTKADSYLKKVENLVDTTSVRVNFRGNIEISNLYIKIYKRSGDYKKVFKEYKKKSKAVSKLINFQDKTVKEAIKKESILEDKINTQKNKQLTIQKKTILFISLLLLVLIFFLFKTITLSKTIKKSLTKITLLNKNLKQSNSQLNISNQDLEIKNNENIELIQLNERTLFSKTLKISTNNEIISKTEKIISNLIDTNKTIKPNDLFSVKNKLQNLLSDSNIWEEFELQFEKVRPGFFKKLKFISPELTVNELKNCAYVITKLRSKDVANLINVSPRSVETTRYRIKKKLNLDKKSNLYDFLQKI